MATFNVEIALDDLFSISMDNPIDGTYKILITKSSKDGEGNSYVTYASRKEAEIAAINMRIGYLMAMGVDYFEASYDGCDSFDDVLNLGS